MDKLHKITLLSSAVLMFAVLPVFSQTGQYVLEHLTVEQGLSHNMTNCVIQDSKSFIWIGTNRGLNRFDGNSFKIYSSDRDSTSLSGVVITELLEDKDGNIWVGTQSSGLNRYNRALDNFTRHMSDPADSTSLSDSYVSAICQDSEGTIWVGTYGGGLNKFHPEKSTFSIYKLSEVQANQYADRIYDVLEDDQGVLWVATEAGLFIFDRYSETFHPVDFGLDIPVLRRVFQCIYQDKNNVLWFGSYHGLIKYNNVSNVADVFFSAGEEHDVINCITGSGNGEVIWIGTLISGLKKFDVKNTTTEDIIPDPQDPYSLAGNFIKDLCIDHTNNLWIGTYQSGLNKLHLQNNIFQQYLLKTDQNDLKNEATTFLLDKMGNLWVGVRALGLVKLNKRMKVIAQYEPRFYVPYRSDSIETSHVSSMLEDTQGNIWACFELLGLTVFDTVSDSFIPVYGIPGEDDTMPVQVRCMIEDYSGRIWLGDAVRGG